MMPGLVHNILSLSAASSTSRAAERGAFPKPFNERLYAEEATAAPAGGPPLNPPLGAKAVRIFHTPASQAMRLQYRLNPAAELVSKAGLCGDRRVISTERMLSGCGSSGSDHEPSSVCLAAMVNEFMENECACGESSCTPACRADSCDSLEDVIVNGVADIPKSLQSLARCRGDEEMKLLRDAQAIVVSIAEANHSRHPCVDERTAIPTYGCRKRIVMSGLQRIGYDAAVCKTQWDHASGIPEGDYEYIDVLLPSHSSAQPVRLIVDIDFQAQFEIARPSSEFSASLQLLPPIFVGRPERLQPIVHLMAEVAKQSLRIKGLHLPPWRKLGYMKAKWFSSYKRTTNNFAGHTRKQAGDCVNGGGFTAGIAMRRCGVDPRCTNEFELLYYGSKLLAGGRKEALMLASGRDDLITVSMTDWQLPPVEMRSVSRSGNRSEVTGLASMLLRTDPLAYTEVVAKAA